MKIREKYKKQDITINVFHVIDNFNKINKK